MLRLKLDVKNRARCQNQGSVLKIGPDAANGNEAMAAEPPPRGSDPKDAGAKPGKQHVEVIARSRPLNRKELAEGCAEYCVTPGPDKGQLATVKLDLGNLPSMALRPSRHHRWPTQWPSS